MQRRHGNPPSPWQVNEFRMMYHTVIPISAQSLSSFLPPLATTAVLLSSFPPHIWSDPAGHQTQSLRTSQGTAFVTRRPNMLA